MNDQNGYLCPLGMRYPFLYKSTLSKVDLYKSYSFILESKRREARYPKSSAPDMPIALAVKPPEKIPKKPSSPIAFLIPLKRVLPKPSRGTLAPQPANSKNGS